MVPDRALVDRFADDLDALTPPDARIGVAVSGGPDSLALLLLAAAARPGRVEAATVDHGLRAESREEAAMVARLCGKLGVPHAVLTVDWDQPPRTALQERARAERYALLGRWATDRGLAALLAAHHADDQAETVLMRLARGAGVRGLGGMRPRSRVPGTGDSALLRPLLGWRRAELEKICRDAGVTPAADPSNEDRAFERVRIRKALAEADWLEADVVARSAANLSAADEALDWAAGEEWERRVTAGEAETRFDARGVPDEIRRRIVARILSQMATEGAADPLRGRELDRLLAQLESGQAATLRGVRCADGELWRFAGARARRTR